MGRLNKEGQINTSEDQQMYEYHMFVIRPHKEGRSRLADRNLRLQTLTGKQKEFTRQIMNICDNHFNEVD